MLRLFQKQFEQNFSFLHFSEGAGQVILIATVTDTSYLVLNKASKCDNHT